MSEPVFNLCPDFRAPPRLRTLDGSTPFSETGTPLGSLVETIMSDRGTNYDPMTHLCMVVATRVATAANPPLHEWAARHVTLPRNPHIIGWRLPEYLWPSAEADLYLCQTEAGWFEALASVTTAGCLRDDAEPIRQPTPIAQAWQQTTERHQAKAGVWRIAEDRLVHQALRDRSNQIRKAKGQDPATMANAVASMELWDAPTAEAALRQTSQQSGMTWCARHRNCHPSDRACWGCSRNADLN